MTLLVNQTAKTIGLLGLGTILTISYPARSEYQLNNNITLHGYLKADVIYDTAQTSGDRINYGAISTSETHPNNRIRLHARESRIGFKYQDDAFPSAFVAYVEGDFFGGGSNSADGSENIANASGFALRHAYINYQQWTFGQTWSNYVDVRSFPETLDLSNDTGQAFLRQGLLRYQFDLRPIQMSIAIENPETDVTTVALNDNTNSNFTTQDPLFDLTARAIYPLEKGHVSVQTVVRSLSVSSSLGTKKKLGVGIGMSGRLNLTMNNQIRFHYSAGEGIGRYLQEASGAAATVYPFQNEQGISSIQFDLVQAKGGYIAFQHKFSDELRVNMSAGFLDIDLSDPIILQNSPDEFARFESVHSNLIWQISSRFEIGVEHSRVKATAVSGAVGKLNRYQFSTIFKF